jgi:hypothetical protein
VNVATGATDARGNEKAGGVVVTPSSNEAVKCHAAGRREYRNWRAGCQGNEKAGGTAAPEHLALTEASRHRPPRA